MKSERVNEEIIKTKEKISDLQERLRELEQRKIEIENTEIVALVRNASIAPKDLNAFIEAYRNRNGAVPTNTPAEQIRGAAADIA